ncbi:M17 family metallopeptidase [Blastomonas sp.]|uniref:leucyl aminopeptidase family protein n=1 Tax=Blastomonas sp. TaxID=1909299 RepID=UPI00261763C7|nr:leucyl aminopeptidase family protein [Blastomonas sp.]MDM7957082.1 leucyl aminopeptidase family protein [Blastomonas sp.]
MIDLSHLVQPDIGQPARTLHLVDKPGLDAWLTSAAPRVRNHLAAMRFTARPHELVVVPGDGADDWAAVLGVSDSTNLRPWCLAKAPEVLAGGSYRIAVEGKPGDAAIGWALAQHRLTGYKKPEDNPQGPRVLLTSDPARLPDRIAEAEATAWVRDMVNTPAEDMGPADLEAAAEALAKRYGAVLDVTRGDTLAMGYPMIHAVGRAAARSHAPRLIELHWGREEHPRLAIVGKGVCFDSGGLDIKPASGMLLMKKDMGGAAHALALAQLIMRSGLPVRLHMLVGAVENAISSNAFRPGDVLKSRKGIQVEIGNTDAEGRLVLGDCLAKASETAPDLMIDFATLTGAARVALGPDLPAVFANSDPLADGLVASGTLTGDPCWRLPLWAGYEDMYASDIADIGNSGGAFAGAVTAALFLQRFVGDGVPWAHFDTFAWRPTPRPGQPKGGEALGLRASWHYLRGRYGASG